MQSHETFQQAVERSIEQMKHLPTMDDRITLHILTEERSAGSFGKRHENVAIDAVPATFKPAKAKYKARALEWFRLDKDLSNLDWVLHLDEETVADEHCICACLDLIEKSSASFGQVSFDALASGIPA